MSASLPGSSDPSRSAAPSAAAPSSVTMRSACGRRHRVGAQRRAAVQRRGEAQRHPEVEVVAGDRPVGAERDPHPGRQHVGHPGDAARELEVRHRVVRDASRRCARGSRSPRRRARRNGRARCARRAGRARRGGGSPSGRSARSIVACSARVSAAWVREEPAALRREPPGRLQPLRADGVGAVREAAGQDVLGAGEVVEERLGVGRRARGAVRPSTPGPSKKMPPVETRRPTARAAATVSRGCQNMSITVVTPPSSSSAKPSVAPSRTVSRFRIAPSAFQTCLQPGLERQVLDQAAEQAVGGVAVGVDQPGHQDHAARRRSPRARRCRSRPRGRCRAMRPPVDRDRAVADHRAGGVGRDDERVGDDEVGQSVTRCEWRKGLHAACPLSTQAAGRCYGVAGPPRARRAVSASTGRRNAAISGCAAVCSWP